MSFADVEARVNASGIRRLANATATISLPADVAGQSFDVIFDSQYQFIDQSMGIESSAPMASANEADIPAALLNALDAGSAVTFAIRGDTWTVVEAKPDGTGFTVLRLRK